MKKTISFILILTSFTVFAQTESWDNAPKELVGLYNSACAKCKAGDTLSAISDLTKSIQLDSNYRAAYAFRGELYRNQKNYQTALLDFKKALAISDYNSFRTEESIGRLKFDTKEYASSYKIYADLVKRDSVDIAVKYYKALSAYYLKDYSVALSELNNAILFQSSEGNNLGFEVETKAYYYRAQSKLKLKQFAEAIEDYELVISRNPPRFTSLAHYEIGLAKQGLNLSYLGDFYRACEMGVEKACYLDSAKKVKTQLPLAQSSLSIDFDQALKKATLNAEDNFFEFKKTIMEKKEFEDFESASSIKIKASSISREHNVVKFSFENECYCVAPIFSVKSTNGRFIEQVLSTKEKNSKRESCARMSTITLLNFDEIEYIEIYEEECGLRDVKMLVEFYTL
jgi:tetratricopeptide (TPR) repeat protein